MLFKLQILFQSIMCVLFFTFCMLSLISEVLRLPLANRSLSRLATDSSPALGCIGDSFSPEEKEKTPVSRAGHVCRNIDMILPVELNIAKLTALLKRKRRLPISHFLFFFDADIFASQCYSVKHRRLLNRHPHQVCALRRL